MRKQIEVILHHTLQAKAITIKKRELNIVLKRLTAICMILVIVFSGFTSEAISRAASSGETVRTKEKGDMTAFEVQLCCLDQSGHNVDAAVEVTGNGNYVLSGIIPEDWLGSIQYLYLNTNLYNGSTTKDFSLEVRKMSVGASHNFYPTGNKGTWQLIGDSEKNFVYQLINPDAYFVGEDLQTKWNDSEPGINEFEKYQISMLRGETVSINFSVSGMNPNEERVTYTSSSDPTDADITQEKRLRAKLDSIQCKVDDTKVSLSDKVKVKSAVKISWTDIGEASEYAVYRSTREYSDYEEITRKVSFKGNIVSYVDSEVDKGKTYYYKTKAFGVLNGESIAGEDSPAKKIVVSKSLAKPAIKCARKGNKATITFNNMEGSGYQAQYRYLDEKKWKKYKNNKKDKGGMTGKIKKTATITLTSNKKLRKIGFALRVRTYMKINGKKVYSSWSSPKSIKG